MKTITSVNNSSIKHVLSLQTSGGRDQHQQFIAEGFRVCSTLVHAGVYLEALYVTQNSLSGASFAPERIVQVTEQVMKKISTAASPSGILGVFSIPQTPDPKLLGSGVVLAQISDPGNMGSLMRTAAALNLSSIVIVEGCDPWNPKVVQASAGTQGLLRIFRWSWQDLLNHKNNLLLQALVVQDGNPPTQLSLDNSLVVIGNEARGIPAEWLENCDQKITLPMPGGTESLNAAIAGSIALYMGYYNAVSSAKKV